jgi:hypothetical protein
MPEAYVYGFRVRVLRPRPGMTSSLWRGAVILAFLAFAMTHAAALAQEMPVKLFKVITAKDEVVIGFTDPGANVENLAQRLVSAGQITAWQYAVQRAADGSTVQAPLRQVAVFKSDTLRIEPYNPAPLKAIPPK